SADPAGNGRGGNRTGLTDSDSGPSADPVGNGRGATGRGTSGGTGGGFAPPSASGKIPGASDQDSVTSDTPGAGRGAAMPGQPRPSKRWR
ncbi:MAG: hypothetical protein KDK12_16665, partial [Rhodobacteraceae bacterium]|nr:hypothetical protein [Paracoccaceae bacterium]